MAMRTVAFGVTLQLLAGQAALASSINPNIHVVYPCPTQCSVILTPSGGDDTALIQGALNNPAYTIVCLSTPGYSNIPPIGGPFHISAPINVPSGKRLSAYQFPASIALPPYKSPTNPGFSQAIVVGHSATNVCVECLNIDGGYPSNCIPSTHPMPGENSFNALVLFGNNITNSKLSRCMLSNPAGWTALQWGSGGSGNLVQYNSVWNSGFNYYNGTDSFWSDGMSFYASNITIDNNTIVDATDQALVTWGTNVTITNNAVYSNSRYTFGAFTFSDQASYAGTVVKGNMVSIENGMVGIAFGFGSALWGCGNSFVSDFSGVQVSGNTVYYPSAQNGGYGYHGYLGYAFVVNGASNLTIGADNYVYNSLPFVTPGSACGHQAWIGGKFLRGSYVSQNPNGGCSNCTLLGGPWTDENPLTGTHLIGPFTYSLPSSCGY